MSLLQRPAQLSCRSGGTCVDILCVDRQTESKVPREGQWWHGNTFIWVQKGCKPLSGEAPLAEMRRFCLCRCRPCSSVPQACCVPIRRQAPACPAAQMCLQDKHILISARSDTFPGQALTSTDFLTSPLQSRPGPPGTAPVPAQTSPLITRCSLLCPQSPH